MLAWLTAAIIIGLNMHAGASRRSGSGSRSPGAGGRWSGRRRFRPCAGLLGCWLGSSLEPLIRGAAGVGRAPVVLPDTAGRREAAPIYRRILVPLDHTDLDRRDRPVARAAMAKLHGATLFLLHVEEGVTSQIYGAESSTAEVEAGEEYLERIAQSLRRSRDYGGDVDLALVIAEAGDRALRAARCSPTW